MLGPSFGSASRSRAIIVAGILFLSLAVFSAPYVLASPSSGITSSGALGRARQSSLYLGAASATLSYFCDFLGLSLEGCPHSATPHHVVTVKYLKATDFSSLGTTTTFTCGVPAGSFLTVSNSSNRVAKTTVSSVTITWAGSTNSFRPSGFCAVDPSESGAVFQNIRFPSTSKLSTSAAAGGNYTGAVTLANGAMLLFRGTFLTSTISGC
jgi:hypothetical protein